MKEIQKQAATRAISLLIASGAQFKVIFPDGTEHGDLEVVTQKKRARVSTVAPGTLTPLYRDRINNAKIGDVVQIAIEDVTRLGATAEGLRSAATSYASTLWGNKTYVSTVTDTHVEILRIA